MEFWRLLTPADLLVTGILAVAVYTDLRTRKIPNVLTFGAMAVALVGNPLIAVFQHEPVLPALPNTVVGIFAAFVPGFIFWNLGGALKAGDAKLLMAIGAILGPFEVLRVFVLVLMLQIPFGIVTLWRAGRLRSLFSVVKAGIFRKPDGPAPMTAPFASVIAAGYVLSRIFPHFFRFWS